MTCHFLVREGVVRGAEGDGEGDRFSPGRDGRPGIDIEDGNVFDERVIGDDLERARGLRFSGENEGEVLLDRREGRDRLVVDGRLEVRPQGVDVQFEHSDGAVDVE